MDEATRRLLTKIAGDLEQGANQARLGIALDGTVQPERILPFMRGLALGRTESAILIRRLLDGETDLWLGR